MELKQFGIDVIIIETGAIQTSFGDVMLEPMMKRSGHTAYADLAKQMEKATIESYENGSASPPSVIAKVIAKAIRARRPKTRYAAGKLAKPLMFLRKWFGDRVFDRAVMSAT